jgi:hypothetical protein
VDNQTNKATPANPLTADQRSALAYNALAEISQLYKPHMEAWSDDRAVFGIGDDLLTVGSLRAAIMVLDGTEGPQDWQGFPYPVRWYYESNLEMYLEGAWCGLAMVGTMSYDYKEARADGGDKNARYRDAVAVFKRFLMARLDFKRSANVGNDYDRRLLNGVDDLPKPQ